MLNNQFQRQGRLLPNFNHFLLREDDMSTARINRLTKLSLNELEGLRNQLETKKASVQQRIDDIDTAICQIELWVDDIAHGGI